MTYEGHFDEVTTLITEKCDAADEAAIQTGIRADADDRFSGHGDDPPVCMLDRVHKDAQVVFRKNGALR